MSTIHYNTAEWNRQNSQQFPVNKKIVMKKMNMVMKKILTKKIILAIVRLNQLERKSFEFKNLLVFKPKVCSLEIQLTNII